MCLVVSGYTQAQELIGFKTNLLYGSYAQSPNLGVEIGLTDHLTVDISGGYNWFNLDGSKNQNKKKVHWMIQPEARYYLTETFKGHFFGLHGLYSQYNIGGHNLPLLLGKGSKEFRHEGWLAGGGLSYGYQLPLAKNLNVEFNIGVGYAHLKYDKYLCPKCGEKIEGGVQKHYFGPTKAGISLIWIMR